MLDIHEVKQREAFKRGSANQMKSTIESQSVSVWVVHCHLAGTNVASGTHRDLAIGGYQAQGSLGCGSWRRGSCHLPGRGEGGAVVRRESQEETCVSVSQVSTASLDPYFSIRSDAESRAAELEKQLAFFDSEHPDVTKHMRSEAAARQELAKVSKLLKQYQSTYGESSTLLPDAKHLSEQLQRKEEEVKLLKLQEEQRAQAETSLYGELDRLSAVWEALDKQVKSKVFDLVAMEDKLAKAVSDVRPLSLLQQ